MTRAVIGSRHSRTYVSLRASSDFDRLYREGNRVRKGSLVVVSAKGQPGLPQVGFVAGRKVGGAVVRNRAKRRLREATAQVALRDGTAYVVIAQPGIETAPFSQLVEWLTAAVGAPLTAEED